MAALGKAGRNDKKPACLGLAFLCIIPLSGFSGLSGFLFARDFDHQNFSIFGRSDRDVILL